MSDAAVNKVTQLTQLINGVGFPIVMCGALFWYNITTIENQKSIIAELKQVIDNNAKISEKLLLRVQGDNLAGALQKQYDLLINIDKKVGK